MKTHRLLTALTATLVTVGQTLIFAVDTASTAHAIAPQQAYAALRPAGWRQV